MPRLTRLAIATALCSGVLALGVPAGASPALRLVTEPGDAMHVVAQAFASATKSINLEMYEFTDPALESLLATKAAHGVAVSVILDREYVSSYNQAAASYLTSHHVRVTWAPASTIYHAKFAVIDGRELLVGTGNLTARYYATTRDFWVVDTQHADVVAANTVFAADLHGRTSVVSRGVDLLFSPGSTSGIVGLINAATSTLAIENEEMDSYAVTDALAAAARRGVNVTVVMTYSSRWSSAFNALRSAGVHVRVLHGEYPIYIHAKAICVDCATAHARAFVGSENFSTSSLSYNRELGIVTSDRSITGPLALVLTHDAAIASAW